MAAIYCPDEHVSSADLTSYMEIYLTFDSDIGLVEKPINAEVIHFGIGSPNENGQLFIYLRPKFHRGLYMDQLLYRVF